MAIKADLPEFVPAPAGTQVVRLVQLIELGEQDTLFGPKKMLHLIFELPNKLKDNRAPFIIRKDVSTKLSTGNKNSTLYDIAAALLGKTLSEADLKDLSNDLSSLVGKVALGNIMPNITKAGKHITKLVSLIPIAEGTVVSPPYNELLVFSLEDLEDDVKFQKLPPFIQEKLASKRPLVKVVKNKSVSKDEIDL